MPRQSAHSSHARSARFARSTRGVMTHVDDNQIDRWVDDRLTALTPGDDWPANVPKRLADAHAKRIVRRARGRRLTMGAVVAGLVVMSVPVTRAFAARCVEACVNVGASVGQWMRPEEPRANAPKAIGAAVGNIA